MTQRRIYTLKLADYLTKKGFNYISIVQDLVRPGLKNWLFEDTPELELAIQEYKKMREDHRNE